MAIFWIIFNAAIVLLLLLDLALVGRISRVIRPREALLGSAAWIGLALIFAGIVHFWMGPAKSVEFMTGYLVEESLSLDNLLVFLFLFGYLKVPREEQRTVLFWGILGALLMRAAFILAGTALVRRFHWVLYALGVFVIATGIRLMFQGKAEGGASGNLALRLAKKFPRVSEHYEGSKFFVVREGLRYATPLWIALLVVEATDILFATDSIPAILAITRDSFIVYTSNAFAVLGLRSLFFALAGLMNLFRYLKYGLAVTLIFIGTRMLLSFWFQIPTWVSLLVIAGVMATAVLASLGRKEEGLQEKAEG